jgi:glycosyltransferase involved in cell wall biosynthesis
LRTVRVLQVVSALGIGGAETWLLELVKYAKTHESLNGIKLEVDIFLTGEDKGALESEFERLGATLIRGRFGRSNLLGFTKSFRRALRQNKYDAIHDHQDNIAGLHFLAGAGLLPPVRVAHVHNSPIHLESYASSPARKATVMAGRYWLRRLGTHVLGTSGQLLGEYGFYGPNFSSLTVMPLYCGIDPALFAQAHEASKKEVVSELNLPHDAKIALFVGRLDSNQNQKNPLFALKTAREAMKREQRLCFLMVGVRGKFGSELEGMVARWEAAPNIRILGPRRDVPRLMAAADVLLAPSFQEGLGMVIVEAQAAGLPVLASDLIPRECEVVPGIVEFLPLQAGVEQWANHLLEIVRQKRPDGRESNRRMADSPFSIENSAKNLMKIYAAVE